MQAKIKNQTPKNAPRFDLSNFPDSYLLANSLSEMFPEQQHENKTVQRAKEILGKDIPTEDVRDLVTSFEYLIDTWLEEYEKKVFDGKTLKEVLQSI